MWVNIPGMDPIGIVDATRTHWLGVFLGFRSPHQMTNSTNICAQWTLWIHHIPPSSILFFVLPIFRTPLAEEANKTSQNKQNKKKNKTNKTNQSEQSKKKSSPKQWTFPSCLEIRPDGSPSRRRCRDQPYLDAVAFSMPWEHYDLQAEISPYWHTVDGTYMTDPWGEQHICLYMDGWFLWDQLVGKYTSARDPTVDASEIRRSPPSM